MKDQMTVLQKLVEKFHGQEITNFRLDLSISEDLGLDGDDAFNLISEYSSVFQVDISKFDYQSYFANEGFNPIALLGFLVGTKKYKKLYVRDLILGIESKKLE